MSERSQGFWAAGRKSCDLKHLAHAQTHTRWTKVFPRREQMCRDIRLHCFLLNETIAVQLLADIGLSECQRPRQTVPLFPGAENEQQQRLKSASSRVYSTIDPHMNFMCVTDIRLVHVCECVSVSLKWLYVCIQPCSSWVSRPSVTFGISHKPRLILFLAKQSQSWDCVHLVYSLCVSVGLASLWVSWWVGKDHRDS